MKMMRLTFLILCLILSLPASARAQDTIDTLSAGGAGGWLNVTRPLTGDDMRGRFVLLDFWTYGCINCIQVVPELEALEREFGDRLLIIGVHSAKFEGEKDNARILAAAKRFGLRHPVLNDSDFTIWNAFNVKAWPTLVLLGPNGKEVVRFAGEGHGPEIAHAIRSSRAVTTYRSRVASLVPEHRTPETLSYPARLATDGHLLFIADTGHHRILVTDQTGVIQTVIGSGMPGLADGRINLAKFKSPRGIAINGGILYVADTGNHAIRAVNLSSGLVETLIGSGKKGDPLSSPWDVEFADESGGRLAIANAGTHQIMNLDIVGKTLSPLAGSGKEAIKDGPSMKAALAQPSALSRSGGNLFFVDAESSALRVIEKGKVRTLVGTGLFDFGLKDGAYPHAMMQHPQGLFASDKTIVIADTYNNALRSYDLKTSRLSTIAVGDLQEPGDVLRLGDTLFIADTNGNRILTWKNGQSAASPLKIGTL